MGVGRRYSYSCARFGSRTAMAASMVGSGISAGSLIGGSSPYTQGGDSTRVYLGRNRQFASVTLNKHRAKSKKKHPPPSF